MKTIKLFAFVFIMFLLVGTVSAANWDNIKEFKDKSQAPNHGRIEVYNSWLIPGVIKGDKISDITLSEHSYSMFTGYSKVDVVMYSEDVLMEKSNLYQGKDKVKVSKDVLKDFNIVFKRKVEKFRDVPQFYQECYEVTNSTNSSTYTHCDTIANGTISEYYEEYEEFDYNLNTKVDAGEYTIELYGTRDSVTTGMIDWTYEALGIETTEYATWWDQDWSYRREISNLTGNISGLYVVDYEANMNIDFSDIVFSDSATNLIELNFSIVDKVNSSYAAFRVNNLGEATINMYYGNAGQTTSTENSSKTYFEPIAGYYLDSDANDFVGNFNGAVTGASLGDGYINGSYVWDKSASQYIDIGNVLPSTNSDYTTTAWIKTTSTDQSDPYIMDNRNTGDGVPLRTMGMSYSSGFLYKCQYRDSSNSFKGAEYNTGDTLNEWVHVACRRSGTNLTIWINGEQKNSIATSSSSLSVNSMMIGASPTAPAAARFNGLIDEAYIYTDALTDNQIMALATQTKSTFILGPEEESAGITTTLNYPINNITTADPTVDFNWTITPNQVNTTNWTLNVWYTNNTLAHQHINTTINTNETVTIIHNDTLLFDESYIWTVQSCGTGDICDTADNETFIIDTVAPVPNITSPVEGFIVNNPDENVTVEYTIDHPIGILDSCWLNTSYNSTINFISCTANVTYIDYPITDPDNLTIYIFSNDSVGNTGIDNVTVYKNIIDPTINITSPLEEYETLFEGQSLNLNWTVESNGTLENCSYVYPPYLELQNGTGLENETFYGWIYIEDKDTQQWSTSTNIAGGSSLTVDIYKDANSRTGNTQQLQIPSGLKDINITDNGWHYVKVFGNCWLGSCSNLQTFQTTDTISYLNMEVPIDCSLNTTTFTYVSGQDRLFFFANDTFGNSNIEEREWIFDIIFENETSNDFAYETSTQEFSIVIDTDIQILAIDSFLSYNGTTYKSDVECSGSMCTLSNSFDIPLVESGESQTNIFFYNFTIFNGSSSLNFQTPDQEQNVSRIHLEECNATYDNNSLNFTAIDEITRASIEPFVFDGTFEYWIGEGDIFREFSLSKTQNEVDLCILPTNLSYMVNADIQYVDVANSTEYITRTYALDNFEINSTLVDIPLELLASDKYTTFILFVQDENLLPVEGAYINIQRCDVGTGNCTTAQVSVTAEDGKTVGFFEVETVDYKFIITQDGEVVLETEKGKVIPESTPYTLTFTIGVDFPVPWVDNTPIPSLDSSLEYDDSSNSVTYIYVDESDTFSSSNLIVQKVSFTNESNYTLVCNESSSFSSASLVCDLQDLNITSGNFIASSYITRSGTALDDQVTFGIDRLLKDSGLIGLFFGWFLLVVASFMFKFNDLAGIWGLIITITLVNLTGLINFGTLFVSSVWGVGFIITWILER